MKSTAGQELDKALAVLEKILETSNSLNEETEELLTKGISDKSKITEVVKNIEKSVEVGTYVYASLRKVYEELTSWIITMGIKYSDTEKYQDMDDRISTLKEGLSDLEDIKYIQLPSETIIREAKKEEEFIDVLSSLDDAANDLASYIESAIDCTRELHPYKVIEE